MSEWEEWFERVWRYREETVYPRIFGTESEGGIYVLTFELFKERFGETSVDPRWLHHGILVYPPSEKTFTWRFVTSGLSNAWEAEHPAPSDWSGLGVEFVLETPERYPWALNVSSNILAYQLLLAVGRFGEARVIEPYARIPLNGPIDGSRSELTYLLAAPAAAAPEDRQLESGKFSLLQLIGVTAAEIEFARAHGGGQLLALLKEREAYPVTNPNRSSVV
jgi:hypothetical protein